MTCRSLAALGNRSLTTQRHIHFGFIDSHEKTSDKTKSSNASLKCPAGEGTSIWAAMKYGEAGMFEFRTYPQGRFEVFVRRWV
jgi:hypothetical protein